MFNGIILERRQTSNDRYSSVCMRIYDDELNEICTHKQPVYGEPFLSRNEIIMLVEPQLVRNVSILWPRNERFVNPPQIAELKFKVCSSCPTNYPFVFYERKQCCSSVGCCGSDVVNNKCSIGNLYLHPELSTCCYGSKKECSNPPCEDSPYLDKDILEIYHGSWIDGLVLNKKQYGVRGGQRKGLYISKTNPITEIKFYLHVNAYHTIGLFEFKQLSGERHGPYGTQDEVFQNVPDNAKTVIEIPRGCNFFEHAHIETENNRIKSITVDCPEYAEDIYLLNNDQTFALQFFNNSRLPICIAFL